MHLPVLPPVSPMLAKLQEAMPRGDGWLYEPKWDGFRAIAFRDGDEIRLTSRDTRPIDRYFPELLDPLRDALPPRCVVDGEVVIAGDDGLDFDALLLRIHPAESRVKLLAEATPSSFVAFDLLALDDGSLMDRPLSERRTRLEAALAGAPPADPERIRPCGIFLTPQTADPDKAEVWFDAYEAMGLDGVIAKQSDIVYSPGRRTMVKIKHKRTADCVVGGYRLSKSGDGVGSLLLGLYDAGGTLHYVGHTSSFKAAERRALLEELKPLEGGTSFVGGRAPGGSSRWTGATEKTWVPLEPSRVCEVSFDHMQGERFRHAATFLRWRPEKKPRDCDFAQLGPLFKGHR
ncbi:MAG: ATP-dependent DNA ligase [Actinomycetota bacterium]|nr:ATP-dependent DNA ligase [Actinomycetota bacterium]